ncbi:MAG TPA: holo-ACP synthase [Waddliaceae bacterium]
MAQGIGIDIIEVIRIDRVILRYGKKFLDRLFTEDEQGYCLRHQKAARHFAARFAAKEAIAKALGTGIREGISWLDIEIGHDHHGKPIAKLSATLSSRFNYPNILLSISHTHEYAAAVALLL